MMRNTLTMAGLAIGATLAGCKGNINLGGGPEADARLTSDVYTWECQDPESAAVYEGVFAFDVALEYAPDGLQDRDLPAAGGCSAGLSMFPQDAGTGGSDLPDLTRDPTWLTETEQGRLERITPGFYYDEVLNNVHSCQDSAELLGDGVTLDEAASLDGVATPSAGGISWVTTDIDDDDGDGNLTFGEDVNVEWDADGWDEVWIQIRQERDGEAWGTVTCNASGEDSFDIDQDVWSLLNGQLNVEYINLFVGFQNREIVETESGQLVDTVTRGMHVLVVQEL